MIFQIKHSHSTRVSYLKPIRKWKKSNLIAWNCLPTTIHLNYESEFRARINGVNFNKTFILFYSFFIFFPSFFFCVFTKLFSHSSVVSYKNYLNLSHYYIKKCSQKYKNVVCTYFKNMFDR